MPDVDSVWRLFRLQVIFEEMEGPQAALTRLRQIPDQIPARGRMIAASLPGSARRLMWEGRGSMGLCGGDGERGRA